MPSNLPVLSDDTNGYLTDTSYDQILSQSNPCTPSAECVQKPTQEREHHRKRARQNRQNQRELGRWLGLIAHRIEISD
jgi:hypothetical protein